MWGRITRMFGYIQVNELTNYQEYITDMYADNQLVGHPFPVISIQTGRGDTIQTDFSTKKGGLVLLFEPLTCQPCMNLLLNTLQHIYDNLTDHTEFSIYGITIHTPPEKLPEYQRVFKLKYPLGIALQEDLLPARLTEYTPTVFLVDSNNTILQCHRPTSGNEQFLILFFKSILINQLSFMQVDIEVPENSPLRLSIKSLPILEVVKGNYNRDILVNSLIR